MSTSGMWAELPNWRRCATCHYLDRRNRLCLHISKRFNLGVATKRHHYPLGKLGCIDWEPKTLEKK